MHKKIQYRRAHLIAYDAIQTPLWSLPAIVPSPNPPTTHPAPGKRTPRKIHLMPMSIRLVPRKTPLDC